MLLAGCLVGGMVVWGFMVVIVSVVGVTGWFVGVLGLCVWFAVLIWWFIVVLDGCCCCSISLVAWFLIVLDTVYIVGFVCIICY